MAQEYASPYSTKFGGEVFAGTWSVELIVLVRYHSICKDTSVETLD